MRKYPDQLKLVAVKDYCTGESGLKSVASRHGVDVSMLREWVAALRSTGLSDVAPLADVAAAASLANLI
jgi:transposase